MFGRKKKELNSFHMMHYEGLPGFKQDFACTIALKDDCVAFEQQNNVVKLPYAQIVKVDAMPEINFMAKYHANGVQTKKGTVWFRVITYTNSTGEERYIALWDISFKTVKFFEQLETRIVKKPTEITL